MWWDILTHHSIVLAKDTASRWKTSIYVRPDCTGNGVGRTLLGELLKLCKEKGCHSMVACVCGINAPSVALHAGLGFQVAGILPEAGFKFGQWLMLTIMHRMLVD